MTNENTLAVRIRAIIQEGSQYGGFLPPAKWVIEQFISRYGKNTSLTSIRSTVSKELLRCRTGANVRSDKHKNQSVYFTELQSKIIDLVYYCEGDSKKVESVIDFIRSFSNLYVSMNSHEKVEIQNNPSFENKQTLMVPQVIQNQDEPQTPPQETNPACFDRKEFKKFIAEMTAEQLKSTTPKKICEHFGTSDTGCYFYVANCLRNQRKKQKNKEVA